MESDGDGCDLPQARSIFIADIFIDRAMHSLSALLGVDAADVDSIREKLEAGVPVGIEVETLHTNLVQAGFIQGSR